MILYFYTTLAMHVIIDILYIYIGFYYLHDGCRPRIIHGDIKTSNILLGENLEVRIGDFGLSRIFEGDELSRVTSIGGTPGYIDPE
jgi:serine/threonine protein kinase